MISTLIALVLSLLVQVQQPNVPVQLKIQGLELANQILLIAQAEQDATTTQATTTQPVQGNAEGTQPAAGAADNTDVGSVQSAATSTDQGGGQQDQQSAPQIEAPTCTLSAAAVAVPNSVHQSGGWYTQFSWQYTQGAYATISSGGKVVFYPNAGTTFNSSLYEPSAYVPIYTPSVEYDYEMDVSLDGLTGSCTASTTIPTGN